MLQLREALHPLLHLPPLPRRPRLELSLGGQAAEGKHVVSGIRLAVETPEFRTI
jgi:hypothetical protein